MTGTLPGSETGPARRAQVLARLREVGVLSVTDLARELGVSHMTVRRDLHRLEATGHVRTVHGGVGLTGVARAGRTGRDLERHRRIARRAAEFVGSADAIAVDAGTCARELTRVLPASFAGSVITHSMPVMQLFAERAATPTGPRLVALGGELSSTRQALVGPATLEALGTLRARTFFLDPGAVDARGVYASSRAEASVAHGLVDIADRVVLLATRETFTGSAPALVTRLDRLRAVVTDEPPPGCVAEALSAAGAELIVAH